MKKNMGSTDKLVRVIIAILIAVLYFTGVLKGTAGIVLLIIAGIFLITSLIGFCPLYTIFGWSTCKKEK
ncbi:MAG: DUF2892 domain-containing protein [Bacteroidales bacterium]|nr:DUF2892 domain-containing protein [Bacteroidales bacterium]